MASARGTNEEERSPFYIPDVGRVDPRSIGSIYGMPAKNKEPEYIPYNPRGRDVTGRLFFNSGAFWLGGFTLGGLYGAQEGYRGAASPIARIRFNSVMNAMSRRGSLLGNSLGVIGKCIYHAHLTINQNYFQRFFRKVCRFNMNESLRTHWL